MSGKIKDNLDIMLDSGVAFLGSILSDTLVGQIAPGVATTYLGYKQKKAEEMINCAIKKIQEDIDGIKGKLKEMSEEEVIFMRDKLILIAFENISRELQEDKLNFIINGIKTTINNKITDEDMVIAYYDILKDLRMIDIRILIDVYKESQKTATIYEVDKNDIYMNKYEAIETHIIRKLENLCLVTVKKTIREIEGSFSKATQDRVRITTLGDDFIKFFCMSEGKC